MYRIKSLYDNIIGCDNRVGLANLEAKLDHQTGVIINMFKDNEITNLRDKVADLQIKTSQCDQNAYLIGALAPKAPVPAYTVPSPYMSYGWNGGCNGYNGF